MSPPTHSRQASLCIWAGALIRTEQARDRELRVLAVGQSDVDRAFMESEFAKARAGEHRAQADLTELKAKHEMLILEHKALQLHLQALEDEHQSILRQAKPQFPCVSHFMLQLRLRFNPENRSPTKVPDCVHPAETECTGEGFAALHSHYTDRELHKCAEHAS
jgi:hypothetical protein